ncbi:MAG TPA: FAD-dependent oxidoreductase [Allosphingosinicella sp.]
MAERPEAIVLGAGVVGMATAYALARRGVGVLILDRSVEPGRGTSFANGAQLSYAYTDALGTPALLRKLPMLALGADPAFRLRPSMDPGFIRWGLSFLRNSTAARSLGNTLEGLRLGLESRAAMHALLERHPLDFLHSMPGKLHLYEDSESLAAASAMVERKRREGAVQEVLSPAQAVALEPALASAETRLSGAVYSPEEEVGDPYLFCRKLLETLKSDYRVQARFGVNARLEIRDGRPDVVLADGERIEAERIAVCTGVDTPKLLKGTGIRVPIWPMRGYSITAPPGPDAPRISITDARRKVVFCRLGERMRIAGLADLGSRSTDIDAVRLKSLIDSARASLPGAVEFDRVESSWAGLRPMTPSSLPVIRKEGAGLVLNVGHGGLGWTFAMGSGERAAALMLEKLD